MCYGDGMEVIVGVRGEVQQRRRKVDALVGKEEGDDGEEGDWVDVTLDVPGMREDDNAVGWLAGVVGEGVVVAADGGGGLEGRLRINGGWNWGLGVDVSNLPSPLRLSWMDGILMMVLRC